MIALTQVDAHDTAAILQLQTDIRAFERIVEWIGQAIAEGIDAHHALSEDANDDLATAFDFEGHDEAEDFRRSGGFLPNQGAFE